MKYIFTLMSLVLGFVASSSFAYADIAGQEVTKDQACAYPDGRSMDRLQIVSPDRGNAEYTRSQTEYFYKRGDHLFYIVFSGWRYFNEVTDYGSRKGLTARYISLYSYDCTTKAISKYPVNFKDRLAGASNGTTGYNPYFRRDVNLGMITNVSGTIFDIDFSVAQEGSGERLLYDAISNRSITNPSLFGLYDPKASTSNGVNFQID